MELGTLCSSLHTPCSAIYRPASRALEGIRDRGGGWRRWSMDQPWIVSPQYESKCKQVEDIFKRKTFGCAPNQMSTVVMMFGLGEK